MTAREVCADTGDSVELIDIDADPALRRRWTDEVPVTFVDGRQHDFWRLDPDRLRAALADSARGTTPLNPRYEPNPNSARGTTPLNPRYEPNPNSARGTTPLNPRYEPNPNSARGTSPADPPHERPDR